MSIPFVLFGAGIMAGREGFHKWSTVFFAPFASSRFIDIGA
jgi:hypothetical protein